ncbi:MAG: Hsp20/alpha crystallin family protein [Candidatus Eremiobacteraeota bacterium]|nr:Hsp20/alpha crystallin family protein [Candidatus Eremiobacteraeota bacterium]MBV8354035.1 Hsp20/alpha crystallin family protein [Candidatus Eremiobacteraeota bacterium]
MREKTAFDEFDRWFLDLTGRRAARFDPNTDVFFDPEGRKIVVAVEIAGADEDSLSVAIDDQAALYITGRRADRSPSCGSLMQKEIAYGEFAKKLQLPAPIDIDSASANYLDGILTITLPVSPQAEIPTRRVLRMTVRRATI